MRARLSTGLLSVLLLVLRMDVKADSRSESLAQRELPEQPAYKLTTSLYRTDDGYLSGDINLRGGLGPHVAWLGFYRDENGYEQSRGGYENTWSLPFGKLVSSFQFASRGFAGIAETAEIGGEHYFLLGLSRTNLRDYYNLTFDPNDSLLFGVGSHTLIPRTQTYLFTVRDNRLDTGQRITHLVLRWQSAEQSRWTLDIAQKSGRGEEDVQVNGNGWTLGYDIDRYFLRAAYDPKVNFTARNMLRLSVGLRF